MAVVFEDNEEKIQEYRAGESLHILLENPKTSEVLACLTLQTLRHLEITGVSYEVLAESLNMLDENVSQIRYLFINQSGLTNLPDTISKLNKLELLDVSQNDFKEFPKAITSLVSLQYLCIGHAAIENVPKEVEQLENLILLSLNNRDKLRLTDGKVDFPKMVGNTEISNEVNLYLFKQLQRLDLAGIKSETINKIDFSHFQHLRDLSLWNCHLSSIPDAIFNLPSLETLDVAWNQLDTFPIACLKMPNLKQLFLARNNIKFIPSEVGHFNFVDTKNIEGYFSLELRRNPIENIPAEILEKGFSAIKGYFDAIESGKKVPFHAAKLMLVGRGGVGKTSLMKRLKLQHLDIGEEDTTKGIDISEWSFPIEEGSEEEFEARIWDFGGQSHYLSPHQFFLTHRSLYIVVWEAREEDDLQFDDWLNLIKTMSDNSPVIVVMNKCEQRTKSIDEAGLKKRFPNILNFHKVSCAQNLGIDALRIEIQKTLIDLKHVKDQLPVTWKILRNSLEKQKNELNYISLKEYYEKCKSCKLNKDEADILSGYLHDLGTIIHFPKVPLLKDTIILNSKWLTQAIYAIIDDINISNNYGKFRIEDLQRIWDSEIYPEEKHPIMLKLLEKYGICFETSWEGDYLTPHLLSPSQPDMNVATENNLIQKYRYAFLPNGLMTKFIIRNHQKLQVNTTLWRHGVVQRTEEVKFLITENRVDKTLILQTSGKNRQSQMLWLIEEIKNLNQFYTNLEVNEMIACKCDECKDSTEPHFYELTNLLYRLNLHKENPKKKNTIECPISTDDIEIESLLPNTPLQEEVHRSIGFDNKQETKHIFISYANKDEKYLPTFKEHLASLKRENKITTWDETDLMAGDTKSTIFQEINKADIIVCLISSRWIGDETIMNEYFPHLLKRHNEKKAHILPVLLAPCLWNTLEIGKLVPLPKNGEPISSWESQDDAWLEIINNIKKIL